MHPQAALNIFKSCPVILILSTFHTSINHVKNTMVIFSFTDKKNMGARIVQNFESALTELHKVLNEAKTHYKKLFELLISGHNIAKELETDVYGANIISLRRKFHKAQQVLSASCVSGKKTATLTELSQRVGKAFTINVVETGRKCLQLYAEIQNISHGIETYYASKVEEYRNFFERVYKDRNKDRRYHIQNTESSEEHGLLVCKNA